MTDLVFYFEAHQPYRLVKKLPRSGKARRDPSSWFDDEANAWILRRVAERCYRPMNALLLELVDRWDGEFRCSLSLSGTLIQQLEDWSPETLESFQKLAATGCVEFLCETTHHSLAGMVEDHDEFETQVRTQRDRIERLFGRRPTTFRNTELILDERICRAVEDLGFDALLGEGADFLLGFRRPHYPFRPRGCETLQLMLRDYVFSDDIGFRFSDRTWDGYPLFTGTYAERLSELPEEARLVGLFMDYETFGEHQWKDTGIFEFMRALPAAVLEYERFGFKTPSEAGAEYEAAGELVFPRAVSWADAERDLSAWLGNPMQRAAHERIYSLRDRALAEGPEIEAAWRKLLTSDHTYYMATKRSSDGDVHEYFSPYASPHDAFMIFMDVVDALEERLGS